MTKLRAGQGAEAEILTKMITPKQAVPHKDHRSSVILMSRVEETGKYCFLFHFVGADDTQFMHASCQFVKILKEGDPSSFFDEIVSNNNGNGNGNGKTKFLEPKIKWAKSRARKLLYTDVKEGSVPLYAIIDGKRTTDNKEVYKMHPEYAEWNIDSFGRRLGGLRKIITAKNVRADDDQKAFDKFVENNEVSTMSHKGYIQWQGSDAQRLLKEDIKDGVLDHYTKKNYPKNHRMEFWLTRPEYCHEFPLHVFRDKMRQEIGTAKYLYTLKARGKKETYKYN